MRLSGHSGRVFDKEKKKDGQLDGTLIPVDFVKAGPVRAGNFYSVLICAMPAGVILTCVIDCCHGGSVVDLPYRFTAGDDQTENQSISVIRLIGSDRDDGYREKGSLTLHPGQRAQ